MEKHKKHSHHDGCNHDCHDHHGHHDHQEHHEHDHDCGCGCGCEHEHHEHGGAGKIWRYLIGALFVVAAFLPFLPPLARLGAALVGYLWFGAAVWWGMLRGFFRKKPFTEFTLMCVATLGAFYLGEYADAAAVMLLYSLGEELSHRAYERSKESIEELIALTPEQVTVLREQEAVSVPPSQVEVGECFLVRAGERVALDGCVVEGGAEADASSVTGEAKSLALHAGVFCPSGVIVTEGSVTLRAEKRYEDSTATALRRAVEEAAKRKAPTEKRITRFAAVFVPIAFALAILTVAVGTVLTGDFAVWLRAGMMILVVCCPCSLVLSVPLAYFAGIGAAAKRGIVFRGGEDMDAMRSMRTLVLDKTGTITEKSLQFDGAVPTEHTDRQAFLRLSYDVLLHSPHAAAQSFCEAQKVGGGHRVEQVEILSGLGMVCQADGKKAVFGNAALLRSHGFLVEESDGTVIYGAYDGEYLGKLCFSAHLKAGTAEAVQELRRMGVRRVALVSGDVESAVAVGAKAAGIDEYYAGAMPAQKVEIMQSIRAEEKEKAPRATVAFCGDGMNDSAVIAQADVGIAMGQGGAALTVQSADVLLMDDDPARLCDALRYARRTSRIAGYCIALSLGMKLAIMLLGVLLGAIGGISLPMEIAIIADVGAAVIAVLCALRAGKTK